MVKFFSLLCVAGLFSSAFSCTLIAIGRKASLDGSTMAIQTNDCIQCDFRIASIKPKKHKSGAKYGAWQFRHDYPRYVGDDRGDMYKLENIDRTIYPWNNTNIMGYIDQVPETYGYLDGGYPIINDQGLGFGESTCAGKLTAKPISQGGYAMFDVSQLMRVASERTSTAREAIQLMGDLAVAHGFYGAGWEGAAAIGEAGEALGVIDKQETWIFHVMADDTAKSAVWVAQRVPDDHIMVIANQFVIRNVDLSKPDQFMGSSNMEEVALRAGLWTKEQGSLAEGTFDFTKAFARTFGAQGIGITRRVWRVYDRVAPGLNLPGETDEYGSDYPVTVRPERKLSAADVMALLRDHFEGTPYDMTKGMAAGAFGNPNRFDRAVNFNVGGAVTPDLLRKGNMERSISWFTTSYSFIAVSRELPLPVGPMAWLGYYAPDASVYFPFYPAAPELAAAVQTGSLNSLSRDSIYWAHAAAANYADRFYKYAMKDIWALQSELEPLFMEQQRQVEQEALQLLQEPAQDGMTGYEAAAAHLGHFAAAAADTVHTRMWALFDLLLSKYKDGYILADPHSEKYRPINLFYPLAWLENTGFFKTPDTNPLCQASHKLYFPPPVVAAAADASWFSTQVGSGHAVVFVVAACAVGAWVGATMGANNQKRKMYGNGY